MNPNTTKRRFIQQITDEWQTIFEHLQRHLNPKENTADLFEVAEDLINSPYAVVEWSPHYGALRLRGFERLKDAEDSYCQQHLYAACNFEFLPILAYDLDDQTEFNFHIAQLRVKAVKAATDGLRRPPAHSYLERLRAHRA